MSKKSDDKTETKNADTPTAKTKEQKSAAPVIFVVLLFLGVVIFGGLYASSQKKGDTEHTKDTITASASDTQDSEEALEAEDEQKAAEVEPAASAKTADNNAASDEDAQADAEDQAKDNAAQAEFEKLVTPRIMGNPNSPVEIAEHSSFTCGACANYHMHNLQQLKKDFIDTGKAHIVFDDFPRNGVDIQIGAVARCLPESSYFNFVQLLFETQSKWASQDQYKNYVKQNAILAGLNPDRFDECFNNEKLQKALAASREKAASEFNINATPTLVIDNSVVIVGTAPYEQLSAAIEEEYQKKTGQQKEQPSE